ISYQQVLATADAKTRSIEEQNAFLDNWTAPKKILEKFPYYVCGFDIEKRPVFVFEIGNWKLRSFVEKGGQDLEDLDNHIKKFFRRVEIGSRAFFNESEMGATDSVVITDWEGFSLKEFIHVPTVQFSLNLIANFQRIQDSFAYGYYFNVNAVASQFIALAKPILGRALERLEIMGTQKSIWIPILLRTIDPDQLPPWYGGSVNDNFKPVAVYG
ncbi:unnamed protein product, partial [Allacma fusca]